MIWRRFDILESTPMLLRGDARRSSFNGGRIAVTRPVCASVTHSRSLASHPAFPQRDAAEREECLQAVLASVCAADAAADWAPAGDRHASTTAGRCAAVLIAFNLFALEAWHIAEALGARRPLFDRRSHSLSLSQSPSSCALALACAISPPAPSRPELPSYHRRRGLGLPERIPHSVPAAECLREAARARGPGPHRAAAGRTCIDPGLARCSPPL